jgi:hypothetical protein
MNRRWRALTAVLGAAGNRKPLQCMNGLRVERKQVIGASGRREYRERGVF